MTDSVVVTPTRYTVEVNEGTTVDIVDSRPTVVLDLGDDSVTVTPSTTAVEVAASQAVAVTSQTVSQSVSVNRGAGTASATQYTEDDDSVTDVQSVLVRVLREHIDPTDARFGAQGDGSTDDTSSIQAAVDHITGSANPVSTTRRPSDVFYFPRGQYKVTAPIEYTSVIGLHVLGAGRDLTRFKPVGTLTSVFDFNGVSRSTIEGFTIAGDGTEIITDVIRVHHAIGEASRTTNYTTLRHIQINSPTRYVRGVVLGLSGENTQCDTIGLYDVNCIGGWNSGEATYWQSGIHVGSGAFNNNLGHKAYDIKSTSHKRNVYMDRCQLGVFGFEVGEGESDFYFSGHTSFFVANGGRCEGSERLIELGSGNSNPSDAEFSNIDWKANQLASDGRWVVWRNGGNLRLRGIRVYASPLPRDAVIYTDVDPGRKLTLSVDGLTLKDNDARTTSDFLADSFDVDADTVVMGRAFTQVNTSGQAAGQIDEFTIGTPVTVAL